MSLHTKIGLIKIDEIENKYMDTEGYLYSLTTGNMKVINRRNSSPARFFRNNPYTLDNIKLFISIYSPDIKVLSDVFDTAKSAYRFECSHHGLFEKSWNEIKNGQYCPKCGILNSAEVRKNNIEDVRDAFKLRSYHLVSEVYHTNDTPLEYICSKHKDKGIQFLTWGNFIGDKGCYHCGREQMALKQTKSHEKFDEELYLLHGDKYSIKSNYTKSDNKVDIYCNDCNTSFSSKASHLLAGHMGCRCKSSSLGEDKIIEFLDSNNIVYTGQFRIGDCKNKRPLPFDFAIFADLEKTELLYLIEFQGKQHYSKTGWSSDDAKNEECFIKQQKNDQIKRDYCSKNKIELIEIPYWKINEIEGILTNLLLLKTPIL